MNRIEFSKDETRTIVAAIRHYARKELDQDLGDLSAQMLLDFFAEEIGGYFYNQGLRDARAVVAARAEDTAEAIAGLERLTRLSK